MDRNLSDMDHLLLFNSIRVPTGSDRVLDADEEVFLLYSELQRKKSDPSFEKFRGLGHVDSRQNTLTVSIELKGGMIPKPAVSVMDKKKRAKYKARNQMRRIDDKTIEVTLAQDTTALRSRKGDTGSVLWHASLDFARLILQEAHFSTPNPIFDFEKLKKQHILELGAGTGILSILLSPLCQHYTVTDIPDLIPLIQKNVALNLSDGLGSSPIDLQALDWQVLTDAPHSHRKTLFCADHNPIDVLLIVDCIYHPSLLPPLVSTIDYLVKPGQTVVVVVSELRSEDVVREFLKIWLAIPHWIIYRSALELPGPYVMWFSWKEELSRTQV